MQFSLRGVPREALPEVWPIVAALLAPALARGEPGHTLADVRRDLENEAAMLWVYVDGDEQIRCAVVSQIRDTALEVWLMGGEQFDQWCGDLDRALVRYAGEKGLTAVRAHVRAGLVPKLRALGWKPAWTTMRRAVT